MATIIDLVGNTPLVELTKLNPNPNVKIYGKLEGNNPAGSVKDRPALNMIRSAVERGDIKKGMKLIEATSGNTGIALAMIARVYGVEIELDKPLLGMATGQAAVIYDGDRVVGSSTICETA